MIILPDMLFRLVVALVLGAIMGLERELVGKEEAGIRTSMTVASGACIYTLIGLSIPYLIADSPEEISKIILSNSGFLIMIANIVVGVGFLGAGIIIKNESKVHGLTTAAFIWATAAIGIAVGLGLLPFATVATVLVSTVLYLVRQVKINSKGIERG